MGRCVMVLGVPRSGTSCVAGVLHHLGVDMGEGHLQPADGNNPSGYWEDLRWQKLNKQITGPKYGHHEAEAVSLRQQAEYEALARECDRAKLWGMKDPRLCFTAQFIWPHLEECKVVAVQRERYASVSSLRVHSEKSYKGTLKMEQWEASDLQGLWHEALDRRLAEFKGPVLTVPYEELLAYPHDWVWRIGHFAYRDLPGLSAIAVQRAVEFVQPELRHHG